MTLNSNSAAEFDFHSQLKRHNTSSLKWQRYQNQDVIPMWVADMDLASPPAVNHALQQAVNRGVFGYGEVSSQLEQTFINWCAQEYNWQLDASWLVWLPGVVPGFNLAVEAWLKPEQGIAVQAPVYAPIKNLASLRQRPGQELDLSLNALEQLEPTTKALVLCNPQNPLGKVYNQAELEKIAAVAKAKNLYVISDEIWADLILAPSKRHLPYASLSKSAAEHSITLMAPSKTFNIAGLSCAVAIIPNAELRKSYKNSMRGLMPDMNYLGLHAAQAAWAEGKPWLEELKVHLNQNLDILENWLQKFPEIGYQRPEATFVAWLDMSATQPYKNLAKNAELSQVFLQAGVALTAGATYGSPQHLRLNFGCPSQQLQQALERMQKVLTS